MVATSDRRTATLVVALVAMVFAVVVAGTPKPHRSSEAVLRELVSLLYRSDHRDARVEYDVERVTTVRRTSRTQVTTWFRDQPYLVMTLAGDALTVVTASYRASCIAATSNGDCLQEAGGGGRVDSSVGIFAAVHVTHRYSAVDLGRRNIAGEPARCFRVELLPGAEVIDGLGTKVDLCLAGDGVLLRSEIDKPGGRDSRVAVSARRGVSAAEIARVVVRYGDHTLRGI